MAHTAAVPPADIRVDGKVLFENVANGEVVTLTAPAETYSVDIVPTGKKVRAVLGPVDLTVKAGPGPGVRGRRPGEEDDERGGPCDPDRVQGLRSPAKVDTGTGGQAAGTTALRGDPPPLRSRRRPRRVMRCSSPDSQGAPRGIGRDHGGRTPGPQAAREARGRLHLGASPSSPRKVTLPGGERAGVPAPGTVGGLPKVPENVRHVGWTDGSSAVGDPVRLDGHRRSGGTPGPGCWATSRGCRGSRRVSG